VRVASAVLALVLPVSLGVARAQVEITLDPAMVRGPADAPVTILEFSDYQ